MALTFDATPPQARSNADASPAKLRDEISRLSQRLVRARESYNQDFVGGEPEVPLDDQLAVIESYRARLEIVTAQLREHEGPGGPVTAVPEQPSPARASAPPEPQTPPVQVRAHEVPQPSVPASVGPRPTGTGIANPDGTPLLADGGTVLRTEDAAVGEYVRHVADQRWLTTTGRSAGDDFDAICSAILAALAHKHGVALEDERQRLARQVDARYRRDYG